jgi:lipopolysaccharide export system permease protein
MPWTLYRYILFDLLKLLVLSLAVLVVLTSAAVAIKPLSEGLLTPGAFLNFIFYTIPSMVTFTLPFAAAFAGCLVYLRMVNANEVLACRASGMSYPTILGPAAILGVIMAVTLLWLNHWVIPKSLAQAQRQLEQDIPKMLVSKVKNGQPMEIRYGRLDAILHADVADDSQTPPVIPGASNQPNRMILLNGVALVVNNPMTKRVRFYGTAEQADILTFQVGRQTWATLQLRNPSYYNAEKEEFAAVEEPLLQPFVIPQTIASRIELQSISDLLALRKNPESYPDVHTTKVNAIKPFVPLELARTTLQALEKAQGKGIWLTSPVDGQRYRLKGKVVSTKNNEINIAGFAPDEASIEVWDAKQERRRFKAKTIKLSAKSDDLDLEPYFNITLTDSTLVNSSSGPASKRPEVKLPRATAPEPIAQKLLDLPGHDLARQLMTQNPKGSYLYDRGVDIDYSIDRVLRKVTAEMNRRAATSMASLIIMVGACVLAIRMQRRRPLEVYFWVFLTTTLTVIFVQTGTNIVGDPDSSLIFGQIILWTGCAISALATFILYRGLAKT